ncbi:E3 ubiquitin-protein ligase TRIM33 [Ditylenchus destructor]|nr:E3 ubiquitin-protein ligase TRIM33 [Ditylenchus destructor]
MDQINRMKDRIRECREQVETSAVQARENVAKQVVELTNNLLCCANNYVCTIDDAVAKKRASLDEVLNDLNAAQESIKNMENSGNNLSLVKNMKGQLKECEERFEKLKGYYIKYNPNSAGALSGMINMGEVIVNGSKKEIRPITQPDTQYFRVSDKLVLSISSPAKEVLPEDNGIVIPPISGPKAKQPKFDDNRQKTSSRHELFPREKTLRNAERNESESTENPDELVIVSADESTSASEVENPPSHATATVAVTPGRILTAENFSFSSKSGRNIGTPSMNGPMGFTSASTSRGPKMLSSPTISSQNSTLTQKSIANNVEGQSKNGTANKDDTNEDWCYVCDQGCDDESGELGCCSNCPKVYHNICHVPRIHDKMADLPDDWICTRCKKCTPLKEPTSVFTDKEQLLCSKIYLSCFKYKPLADLKVNSGTIHIKDIARKLSGKSYGKVYEFIQDMNNLIKTAEFLARKEQEEIKTVYKQYATNVEKYMPCYAREVPRLEELCPFFSRSQHSSHRKRKN